MSLSSPPACTCLQPHLFATCVQPPLHMIRAACLGLGKAIILTCRCRATAAGICCLCPDGAPSLGACLWLQAMLPVLSGHSCLQAEAAFPRNPLYKSVDGVPQPQHSGSPDGSAARATSQRSMAETASLQVSTSTLPERVSTSALQTITEERGRQVGEGAAEEVGVVRTADVPVASRWTPSVRL